ncbi:MAG: hypothetical protein IPM53_21530 [Anaerolineaceae bacterium]|nr:hypothetical protein [Anaerolineaceae bacterium]
MTLYTVQLPENLYRRLQQQASAEQRSIEDLVRQTLSRQLPPAVPVEDDLPPSLREELLAMEHLSDAALWSLARSTLLPEQLAEMDMLRDTKQERVLTPEETNRQQDLLRAYDETVLRRAHAAMLLNSRGYELTDPTILQ